MGPFVGGRGPGKLGVSLECGFQEIGFQEAEQVLPGFQDPELKALTC